MEGRGEGTAPLNESCISETYPEQDALISPPPTSVYTPALLSCRFVLNIISTKRPCNCAIISGVYCVACCWSDYL